MASSRPFGGHFIPSGLCPFRSHQGAIDLISSLLLFQPTNLPPLPGVHCFINSGPVDTADNACAVVVAPKVSPMSACRQQKGFSVMVLRIIFTIDVLRFRSMEMGSFIS